MVCSANFSHHKSTKVCGGRFGKTLYPLLFKELQWTKGQLTRFRNHIPIPSNANKVEKPMGEDQITKLWEEVRELSLGNTIEIDHLLSPPSPLQFHRDYISPNKPCLISNAISHWPATTSWTSTPYLLNSLSSTTVSLHLTPTGRADSLTPHHHSTPSTKPTSRSLCFASAHVQRLPFNEALARILQSEENQCVAYLQQQNDCFRSEYGVLAEDCEADIPWATEAIGCLPEAVNLWIGNHLSETWFHKDHYENLYAVVSGEKHFLLLPPTDVHRMYVEDYPSAKYQYSQDSGEFRLELEEPVRYVPWCSVNPYPSNEERENEMARFPLYFNGSKPFEVTVKAGEMLYLPSMWFHHVKQSPDDRGLTIAINYWYDMRFDIKYAYFNFLQSIRYLSPNSSALHTSRTARICSGIAASPANDDTDTDGSVAKVDLL